ncbi:Multidrug resistance protein MdtC [compost metagenome]
MKTGVSQMPDVDFPVLSISVTYEGAAPEVVESEIIDPIEEKLLLIEGIQEMRASASQGSGRVTLYFDINRNVDVALQEVQSALSQLRLPTDVDPPVIRKQNPEEDPILILSVFGDIPIKELLHWTDNYLLDQLRFLPGVGEVNIGGFSARNLRVWIDPKKLENFDLSISDVVEALRTQHLESAAGQLVEGERELRLRWLGEATNPDQVENIRILRRAGGAITFDRVIRIKDVARVDDGLSDIRRQARVQGKEAVSIAIRKQRGTNEIDVAKAVRAKIEAIKEQFPEGYNYRFNVDFTKSTEATVGLTIEKLWVAALITILVCFFFLGSIPAAINILFSIPVSIIGTFTILYFAGFTLNLFTLLALTLAISIVVDDAIMLLENIVRHARMGKSSTKAASDGSKEVLPAAVAATLAVIAVFLPVIFMDGIIGKFFFQFGVTMSAAVLLSLLEALTITPMRSAAFMGAGHKEGKFEQFLERLFDRMAHGYQKLLIPTLRWKWTVVLVSMGLFAVSMLLIAKVRQEFVPAQDQNMILINAQTPTGSSLEFTSEVAKGLEKIVSENENVLGFFVSIGGGGGASQVNQVFMPVELKPKENRKVTHTQVMGQLREKFKAVKSVRITMRDISARNLTSGRTNPVAINLRGPDLTVLNDSADKLMERLESEGLTVDMDKDYRAGIPELLVEPDRVKMEKRGVSVESIGQVLSVGVGGYRQGRFTGDGRRYDIRFKIPEGLIKSGADLQKLKVRNIAGNLIPLSELVKVEEKTTSQAINRINRQRSVSVFGNLAPGQSQSVVLKKVAAYAKEIMPADYVFALEGASAGFSESFASLTTALAVGIMVAYMILAVQFNSFVHPISVLIALPFSVTGALIALWSFDVSLNLFSFIGLIVLMGIAKKNSILLVEFTNQVRLHENEKPEQALLKACPVRLRPILMTSVATVAAATPLVFGGGMGSETRLPMGLAIVGGTIVSTILTLFVVPALYLALTKVESKRGIKEREII